MDRGALDYGERSGGRDGADLLCSKVWRGLMEALVAFISGSI